MKETKTGRQKAPARSIEGREQQMIALAMDLAEKKLRDGTASNQLIVHFLRHATVEAELEREKIRADVTLQKTKVNSINSEKEREIDYAKVLDALKQYQGIDEEEDYYED